MCPKPKTAAFVVLAKYLETPSSVPFYVFTVPNKPELEFNSLTISKITEMMDKFQINHYEEVGGGLLLFSEGKLVVDLYSAGFSIAKDYPRIKELADFLVKLYSHVL